MSRKKTIAESLARRVVAVFGGNAEAAFQMFEPLYEAELVGILNEPGPAMILAELGPAVCGELAKHPAATRALFLGGNSQPELGKQNRSPDELAGAFECNRLLSLANFVLGRTSALMTSVRLSEISENLITAACDSLHLRFSVGAIGMSAGQGIGPQGDFSVVLVADSDDARQMDVEAHALLGFIESLRHFGMAAQISVQRAGGSLWIRAGGLSGVERALLEPDEFLLINAPRWFYGQGLRESEHWPLTPAQLRTLMEHKGDLEHAVPRKYRRRNLLAGEGGLLDLWWLINLHEWRYPTATGWALLDLVGAPERRDFSITARLDALQQAQLLTPFERVRLADAYEHLMGMWYWLAALGIPEPVVPENPDKLDLLAKALRLADGNEVLRLHEGFIDNVREIYSDCLDRLRA